MARRAMEFWHPEASNTTCYSNYNVEFGDYVRKTMKWPMEEAMFGRLNTSMTQGLRVVF